MVKVNLMQLVHLVKDCSQELSTSNQLTIHILYPFDVMDLGCMMALLAGLILGDKSLEQSPIHILSILIYRFAKCKK